MFKLVPTDYFFVVLGAFSGALAGPEFSGPLWGSLILFLFGKIIHLGPGPTQDKSWPYVRRCLNGFLLHLKDDNKERSQNTPEQQVFGVRSSADRIRSAPVHRNPHGPRPRLSV